MKLFKIAVFIAFSLLILTYLYRRFYLPLSYAFPNLPKIAKPQTTLAPTTLQNTTGLPLKLPTGFSISTFASGLSGPRDLEFDPAGHLLVSEPSAGRITALFGPMAKIGPWQVIASGLNRPHGLAFAENSLFVAETDQVSVFDYRPNPPLTIANKQKILDLPAGGSHWTRSLLIKDNQLYVSIGSSCNVCHESDPRRAAIYVASLDGTNFRPFATGLRNSVFLVTHPLTNSIWATDMGRDWLGDNLPPDEINIIQDSRNYGWPNCYGHDVLDRNFDKTDYKFVQALPTCVIIGKTGSHIDLPSHSAPLGLAFIPNSWPETYRGDLLVAYHGSWNRSTPAGYKVVRIDLDSVGKGVGESDFITGFLPTNAKSGSDALGRPVDLIFDGLGNLYVSDDSAGAVYQVSPK